MADRTPTNLEPAKMIDLTSDGSMVRFKFPLPVAGRPEPLEIDFDLDAESVLALIERLRELHARMKK